LKYEETGYEQAPYEAISKKQFEKMSSGITPFQRVAHDEGGVGSKFCTNDTCVL
jgi:hypothetical protein